MTKRERIYNKFGGRCAYSGTKLEDGWQIDHMVSKRECSLLMIDPDNDNNLMPCQSIINHYKRSLNIDQFKMLRLNSLHLRLKKLPQKPRRTKSIKHKEYLLKVASYFNVEPNKPFSGKFYFEKDIDVL